MNAETGARLLLPLTRLGGSPPAPAPPVAAPPAPAPPVAAPLAPAPPVQRLDLDAPLPGGWIAAVRASSETCLLLDGDGRLRAASPTASAVLGGAGGAGVRFAQLVRLVDFTSGAAPEIEPERSMPPLRALTTGGLARGLMRLRVADGSLVTYDVVAVPLQGQRGVLAFFLPV